MIAATYYEAERGKLLRAAAWNGYVATRGLNAEQGKAKRKENQRDLAQLRAARPWLRRLAEHQAQRLCDTLALEAMREWAFLCRRFGTRIEFAPVGLAGGSYHLAAPDVSLIVVDPTLSHDEAGVAIARGFVGIVADRAEDAAQFGQEG